MNIQNLTDVCSAKHIHNYQDKNKANQVFQTALKEAFTYDKFDARNPPGVPYDCICTDCKQARKIWKEKYKTEPLPKIIPCWNYRLLIAFSALNQAYFVAWLKEKQFKPISTYIGYQGTEVTIWTLHIPTWFEENKIAYDAKTFEIPKLEKK